MAEIKDGQVTRTYTFIRDSIAQGRTFLVYNTRSVPAKTKHVRSMDRVALVDGVVYVDGQSTKGMTVCLKP